MKVIGLAMVKAEGDILNDTFALNMQWLDEVYWAVGAAVTTHYWTTQPERMFYDELIACRDGYPPEPCDGYRQVLLEAALAEHGWDSLFVLLHADEVWTCDPRVIAKDHPHPGQGFMFRLPLYYAPGAWDHDRGPLEQMTAYLGPGYPEFRMFRGAPGVRYDPGQHFNVTPRGLRGDLVFSDHPIRHYPFRSPASQLARADATFDPDNYEGCPFDGHAIEERFLGRSEHYSYRGDLVGAAA